jgi:hypothetical protein
MGEFIVSLLGIAIIQAILVIVIAFVMVWFGVLPGKEAIEGKSIKEIIKLIWEKR